MNKTLSHSLLRACAVSALSVLAWGSLPASAADIPAADIPAADVPAADIPAADAPTTAPAGHDWPQFRGPDRSGISAETNLLDAWPEGGPPQLWRKPLGQGYSGLTVVGDRLYTMFADDTPYASPATDADGGDGEDSEGTEDAAEDAGGAEGADDAEDPEAPAEAAAAGTEYAIALDANTGAELWRTITGPKLDTEFGNGPRSTPTADGDSVYVLGARGRLVALDATSGDTRWSLELTEAFDAEAPYWGFSTSAVVAGDKLLLETGGKPAKTHAALDKATGEVLWTLGDNGAGYNSPLVVDVEGKKRYVYVSGDRILGLDDAGKEIWSHPWPRGETHAMPVAVGSGRIFASGAEGIGATMLEIDEGDDVTITEVWKSRFMRNHFSSSLYADGYLYGFDNATLKCINAADGELAWAQRGLGKGSLILADGKLFVLTDRGKLVLAEAISEAFRPLGEVQALDGQSWTAPSLAHGRLFVRNHDDIAAFDVRDPGAEP